VDYFLGHPVKYKRAKSDCI